MLALVRAFFPACCACIDVSCSMLIAYSYGDSQTSTRDNLAAHSSMVAWTNDSWAIIEFS